MAFDFSSFNPSENLGPEFDALPAGEYQVVIVDALKKKTRDGSGEYLALTMEVVDGPHRGRMVWHNIMLDHPKDVVARIGRRHLAELCVSCGLAKLANEHDFVNMTALVSLKVVQDEYGILRNQVKGYKPIEREPVPEDADIPF